jgi:hypothetical protein
MARVGSGAIGLLPGKNYPAFTVVVDLEMHSRAKLNVRFHADGVSGFVELRVGVDPGFCILQ